LKVKIKESGWYFITDILLDLLASAYLLFLAWHFYMVVKYGGITVHEPNLWILRGEVWVLVPLVLLFGIWKLIEDIVLAIRGKMGIWHLATELLLGFVYLQTMSFIAYHFWHIWNEGKSLISSDNPWTIMGILIFWALVAVCKAWEDLNDLKDFKKQN